jgi:hypothetical protein
MNQTISNYPNEILLLVACTQSKRIPSSAILNASQYSQCSLESMARQWLEAQKNVRLDIVANKLYKGNYWAKASSLHSKFNLPIKKMIVSAGFGLVDWEQYITSYSITFSPNLPDSIPNASSIGDRFKWWSLLGGPEKLENHLTNNNCYIIPALPLYYLEVILPTLYKFKSRSIIVTSQYSQKTFQKYNDFIITLTKNASNTLGGLSSTLIPRCIQYLLDNIENINEINSNKIIYLLNKLEYSPQKNQSQRVKNLNIQSWITDKLIDDPYLSASKALQILRKEGFAHEQKKFHRLFNNIKQGGSV